MRYQGLGPCLTPRGADRPRSTTAIDPALWARERQASKLSNTEPLHLNLDSVHPDIENLWTTISRHRRNR